VRRGIINHLGSPSVVPYIEYIRHTTTSNSIFQTRRHIQLHKPNIQYTSARVLNINFKSERAGTPKISITEIRYNKI
jgi:hypothetical protein